jgi:hypothetical protein
MAGIDLTQLTQEDLVALKAALGIQETEGTRSPAPRPLRDLRAPTTAKGRLHRPHFEWSAEEPPEGVTIPPFPRLMWTPHGQEVRIESPEHMKELGVGVGWTDRPPMGNEMTAEDRLRAEVEMLSPEDRELLFKSVKEARISSLKERMVGLTNDDIAALMPSKPKPVEKPATSEKKAG